MATDTEGRQVVFSLGDEGELRLAIPSLHGTAETGVELWSAGLLLAKWLVAQAAEDFVGRGRSCLELGCGSAALPSVAAAWRGAEPCLATDGFEVAVAAAGANLARNGVKASAHRLDWGEVAASGGRAAFAGAPALWDVVLFADSVYMEEAAPLLAGCIDALLAPDGEAIGALPELREGQASFVAAMQGKGFVAKELEVPEEMAAAAAEGAGLRRLGAELGSGGVHIAGGPTRIRLVRWRRRRAEEAEDETPQLRLSLLQALGRAEAAVTYADGYLPEE